MPSSEWPLLKVDFALIYIMLLSETFWLLQMRRESLGSREDSECCGPVERRAGLRGFPTMIPATDMAGPVGIRIAFCLVVSLGCVSVSRLQTYVFYGAPRALTLAAAGAERKATLRRLKPWLAPAGFVLLFFPTGLRAQTSPQITSVSQISTQQYQTITIMGSGFGT